MSREHPVGLDDLQRRIDALSAWHRGKETVLAKLTIAEARALIAELHAARAALETTLSALDWSIGYIEGAVVEVPKYLHVAANNARVALRGAAPDLQTMPEPGVRTMNLLEGD